MKLNLFLFTLLVALISANLGVSDNPARPNFEAMPEMVRTASYESFSENPNFPDGKSLQSPPEGAIARGMRPLRYAATPQEAARAGRELTAPASSLIPPEAGARIYQIYCQPCHGGAGKGDGPVALRGFPPPPSLMAEHAMRLSDGETFHILSFGQKNMPSYAAQLSPEDRWRVIGYMRSLQHPPANEGSPQ
jgi:mono/diheme cytochrome c family protein